MVTAVDQNELLHLGELLKKQPHAWRAFNRLMLEEMRRQIGAIRSDLLEARQKEALPAAELQQWRDAQSQILQHLDQLLAQPDVVAQSVADLIVAIGKSEKRLNERLDVFLARVVSQHREVLDNLTRLLDTTDRIEFTVNLMWQYLRETGVVATAERQAQALLETEPAPGVPP
jgi:hypothetical protein